MSRLVEMPRDAVTAIRGKLIGLTHQSARTLLLGAVLLMSALSAVIGFIVTQYFSADVISVLTFRPDDCWPTWVVKVGRHCFGDYQTVLAGGMRPNPWDPYRLPVAPDAQPPPNPYSPTAMLPYIVFGLLGKGLGAPYVGMFCYVLALTAAVLTPAVWAARGSSGLDRVVVFVALGAAAIPGWVVVDRGNSVGFIVPIALVFLVALRRQQWGLVAIMVVLAALVKPQFAVLAVALFAARQWRLGGSAVVGLVIANLVGYLLWPRDFPATIMQSLRNAFLGYGTFRLRMSPDNVSFAKGVLLIPDAIKIQATGGKVPDGFLDGPRLLIGYGVLVLVVVAVLALGRRIPPVMVGIVLLATASLFPSLAIRYYLVFVLPIAALVVRDPDGPPGSGIFDRLGDRRIRVGICVSLASAFTIVAIPGPPFPVPAAGTSANGAVVPGVSTTVALTPLLWLIACAAIILSYVYKPAPGSSRRVPMTPARDSTAARRSMAKASMFDHRRDYARSEGVGSGRAESRVYPET